MYLRTTQRKNKNGTTAEYFQLAESVWNADKKRSEVNVIHNFGRADKLDADALRRLASSIMRVCNGGIDVPTQAGFTQLIEIESSKPIGGIHVARALWEELGIGKTLRKLAAKTKRAAPHETAIFAMVANRLLEPASKLACHDRWLPDQVYFPEAQSLTLEQLYFAMDFLEDNIEEIERSVFFNTSDLFNCDVDLIFWDTTNFYFEIDENDEVGETHHNREYPALRKRGRSKEGRHNNPQVTVGLAVTREGLPVRSWVFPGNTSDSKTIARIKEDLRGWKLGRAIVVGDAGMDSAENRKTLSKGLGKYILAMPMGKLKEVSEKVLSHRGRYRKVNDTLEVKEVVVGDGEGRRRYISCRNKREAMRQRKHREKVLEELRLELAQIAKGKKEHPKKACDLAASGRYGKYLSQRKSGAIFIDPAKVKKAERMDGRYVLLTNDDTLSPEDVGESYKAMMIIESCFRRMKTTNLRTRPIYHWTPHRIISHIKLCVLALLLERVAELRSGDTWRNIRHELERIQAVQYQVENKRIVQTTRLGTNARTLLSKLGVSRPRRVLGIDHE